MQVPVEDILKIGEALIAGSLLGLEREYRSKPAGLRTIIMITVGSTLFSILSVSISDQSPDRIASNIVTGVGFVGAGVIFKEGVNLKGITTAASIWAAAAIGMAIGFGEYWLAIVTLAVVLFTLVVLPKIEERLDSTHVVKTYLISFNSKVYSILELQGLFNTSHINYTSLCLRKNEDELTITYSIRAIAEKHEELVNLLITNTAIKKVEV
ncbi:MAG TPA: MgtC/SapB family protein [Segetibacter sp.]|jgi:putative Mg2+ transporter-C (MgtC) family protein